MKCFNVLDFFLAHRIYVVGLLCQFLAVVYNSFVTVEKEKVRKMLVHRRHAAFLAFRLLTDEQVIRFKLRLS